LSRPVAPLPPQQVRVREEMNAWLKKKNMLWRNKHMIKSRNN
jgi:hypothetical protein